jgi:hypothetical protein
MYQIFRANKTNKDLDDFKVLLVGLILTIVILLGSTIYNISHSNNITYKPTKEISKYIPNKSNKSEKIRYEF